MTDVIAWPPVGLTAWELTRVDPVSRSVGLLDGRPRTSSAQRSRRLATARVSGMADEDVAGAGYIEILKELLAGGRHLVRMECLPPLWHLADQPDLMNGILQRTAGGEDLQYTSGGVTLLWSDNRAMNGVPATQKGWPALTVDGLPPNALVARPSTRITVTDGTTTQASRVLTVAHSDASSVATIRTMDTFTISGLVSIGDLESIVFEALDMPRAVQPVSGNWSYEWSFREVFLDEYADGWTERDPWR